MNLYEFEGKQLFQKHGIAIPRGVVIERGDTDSRDVAMQRLYSEIGHTNVVVKAQILSGKRGKNNGIKFCSSEEEAMIAINDLFSTNVRGQHVASVLVEEKLDVAEEHYISITYDTNTRQPMLIYSPQGGMDIEDVPEEQITKINLDIRDKDVFEASKFVISTEASAAAAGERSGEIFRSDSVTNFRHSCVPKSQAPSDPSTPLRSARDDNNKSIALKRIPYAPDLWQCFLEEDCRLVEINPLVKTVDGKWIAADAKIAIDGDAFYRHKEWETLAPRTEMGRPPTEREISVKKIDEGEGYYRGTAGKYIEMDGDIAILFSGGGASIANMDALIKAGLKPANYTEYSGNPPREKVYELTKIVLSKSNLRGLWIAGGVANFTDIAATFQGIVDALDEIKPKYPIVVRRAGPNEAEGMRFMRECAERNGLQMKLFGKETSMSDTAMILSDMVEDLEALSSPNFLKSIEASRKSNKLVSLDEVKKRYNLP